MRVLLLFTVAFSTGCATRARHEVSMHQADDRAPARLELRRTQNAVEHDLLQTPEVQVHAVVSTAPRPRVLLLFPGGNSGVGLFLAGAEGQGVPKLVQVGRVQAVASQPGTQRARVEVATEASSVIFRSAILDSVRAIREVNDGRPWPQVRGRQAVELELVPGDAPSAVLQRRNLDGSTYRAVLTFSPGTHLQVLPGGALSARTERATLGFSVDATVPYAPLTPFELRELLRPAAAARTVELGRTDAQVKTSLENLRFLSYREKLLAGSWQFLTYFGRDTLLSAMMLEDVLAPPAMEAALASVADRVSADGDVAHEEEIGSWAELVALQRGDQEAARAQAAGLDYKMVDDDFLLAIALERHAARVGPEAFGRFLAGSPGERRDPVLRNADRILHLAGLYADDAQRAATRLVRFRQGIPVGDWRDSNAGNGGGVYSGNVNCFLASQAVIAVQRLLATGALGREDLEERARALKLAALSAAVREPARVQRLTDAWTQVWSRHFTVRLTQAQVRERLKAFLGARGERAGWSEAELGLLKQRSPSSSGVTLEAFLGGADLPELSRGLAFTALSLDDAQRPVAVMNSDLAMALLMRDLTLDELEDHLPVFELEFPLGLRTPVGLMTANPLLSDRSEHRQTLARDTYHGMAVWAHMDLMAILGLRRQRVRLQAEGTPRALAMSERVDRLANELVASTRRAGKWAMDELRAVRLTPEGFQADGVAVHADQEPNPVQLWATVLLAVALDR